MFHMILLLEAFLLKYEGFNLSEVTKVLCIGDSITDCGRSAHGVSGLGNGYVNMLNSILYSRLPESEFVVVNKGINGNTLGHLVSP